MDRRRFLYVIIAGFIGGAIGGYLSYIIMNIA